MSKRGMHRTFAAWSLVAWGAVAPSLALSHEGHRPLPTRGIEVDAASGTLLLSPSAVQALDLQTDEVRLEPLATSLQANGVVEASWSRHAAVASQLPGRVASIAVDPGAVVRKGQPLAEIESPELEQLRLEYVAARTDADLSAKLLQAIEPMEAAGAVPLLRRLEARTKAAQDEAAVEIAAAKWRSMGLQAEQLPELSRAERQRRPVRLTLSSPIDGVVIHADLSVGKVIAAQEHLLEILDLSEVQVKIRIPEKDLHRLVVGRRIELEPTASPGRVFIGTLERIGAALDPKTLQATAWATFKNPVEGEPVLLPGMSGRVRIPIGDERPKRSIPSAALVRVGAERFVLVEAEQTSRASTFRKQSLALGSSSGGRVEVRAGDVFPGDRVVVRGNHELAGLFASGVLTIVPETVEDVGLRVESVSHRSIAETLTAGAVVDVPATRRTSAGAQLGGAVQRILVERGRRVQKGDLLAEVASLEFQTLQLDLLRAELDLAMGKAFLKSVEGSTDAVPQRRRWEAESRVVQAESLRQSLRQRLSTIGVAEEELDRLAATRSLIPALPVRAPLAGVVVGFDKYLGETVRPEEPLFEIHDLSAVRIEGFLSEQDGGRVQIGQTARVRLAALPGEVFSGKVVGSGRSFGAVDHTLAVWVELDGTPRLPLQHRMSARLTLDVGPGVETLAAPREAVVREGARSFVFVRDAAGRFERRPVTLGRGDDRFVEILAGIEAGASIAGAGAAALQTGYAALR